MLPLVESDTELTYFDRSAHFGGSESRSTNFRGEPLELNGGPQTGLSVLMSSNEPPLTTSILDQKLREDMADRERQASALAAAGMVAESVRQTQPSGMGLHPPPPLATGNGQMTSVSHEIDSINWNLMDIGGMHLDDIDMDFATLFDPAHEAANMQLEGSGWPSSTTSGDSLSPTPLNSMQPENHASTAGHS